MLDFELIRTLLDKKEKELEKLKENLVEAYIFLERLEQEDYEDEEEEENFESDLAYILEELQIDVDNYEE